jgi:fimbrial chaperone protein
MNRFLKYIAAVLLLVHSFSLAGEFSVSPIRLNLSGAARSQLLTINNIGSAPARFLVRSAGWTVTEAGAVELSGDDKLVVFPASFVVAPKASQNIRVGTDQAATDTEQTWRIVLEELPNPDAPSGAGTTINVLSVLSVPVFMPPTTARKSMELGLQSVNGVTATVMISNKGNAHEMVSAVSVTALRGEEVAAQAQMEGWYLLPGKRRVLNLKTDKKSWCTPDITSFDLRASDRDGQTLVQQKVEAREVCR